MKAYINKYLLFLISLLILGSFSTTLVFAEIHPFLITPKELHQQAKDPKLIIIGARPSSEYLKGHIPSKLWYSNLANNEEMGRFLELGELLDLYSDVSKNEKVIAYYHKGQHSSTAYFVLRNLGYDISSYNGSWYEWGNDLNLPLELE